MDITVPNPILHLLPVTTHQTKLAKSIIHITENFCIACIIQTYGSWV